jgi:hypothetical protein
VDACIGIMLVDMTHTWVMRLYRYIPGIIKRGGTTSLFPPTRNPTVVRVQKFKTILLNGFTFP